MIEAFYLAPNFLEDLASDNLLDSVSGGVIRMELLCEVASKRSIPDITDILTGSSAGNMIGRFGQIRLCFQGPTLPALSLFFSGKQKLAQSQVPNEVPLIKIIEFVHKKSHVSGSLS
jgi:hypothetical protein